MGKRPKRKKPRRGKTTRDGSARPKARYSPTELFLAGIGLLLIVLFVGIVLSSLF